MKMEFTVPDVKGKGRPRVTKTGIAFTPKETVQFENLVKMCYKQECGDAIFDKGIPIRAYIMVLIQRPGHHYNSKGELKANAPKVCTTKPDADNIGKAILDSLNKVAFHDDSQVWKLIVEKFYGNRNETYVSLNSEKNDE